MSVSLWEKTGKVFFLFPLPNPLSPQVYGHENAGCWLPGEEERSWNGDRQRSEFPGGVIYQMTTPFWTDQLLVDLISKESHAVGAWLKHHDELSPFFATPQALLHYTWALRHGLRPGLREGNLPEPEVEFDSWLEAGW